MHKSRKIPKKVVIKLGTLEGPLCEDLKWKSKDKSISWNFAYYMPYLIRDVLREMASNLRSCPSWLADEFDNDVDKACKEWTKRINKLADKFDYASKIDSPEEYLNEEDKEILSKYMQSHFDLYRKNKDINEIFQLPVPDGIREIREKEDKIREDMQNKLKEALQELGEIWYDLWD